MSSGHSTVLEKIRIIKAESKENEVNFKILAFRIHSEVEARLCAERKGFLNSKRFPLTHKEPG